MNKQRIRFSATTTDARISFTATAPTTGSSSTSSTAAPSLTIGTLKAYPIVWNKLSSDRGGYSVRLVKGSATFTTPTVALYNHHFGRLLGNTASNTLRILPPDDYGIPVEIDLPATSDGHDVATLVARGDIGGMSFTMVRGFEESFTTEENGTNVVNATAYTVDEVSVLVDPAFIDTTVTLADADTDTDSDEPGEVEQPIMPTDALEPELLQAKKEPHPHKQKWEEYRLFLYDVEQSFQTPNRRQPKKT